MADPNEALPPHSQAEVMPDLPGSGTPPIEGRSWVQVKLAVWALVGLVLVSAAWGVAVVVSSVMA